MKCLLVQEEIDKFEKQKIALDILTRTIHVILMESLLQTLQSKI